MSEPTLTDVTGVGPATARALVAGGYTDVGVVASAGVEELAALPGFGPVRAAAVRAAAEYALGPGRPSPSMSTDDGAAPPKGQKSGGEDRVKGKKKKKRRKPNGEKSSKKKKQKKRKDPKKSKKKSGKKSKR